METAKVDIRKLQTLSDCINRTIEALNQVRLSVHAGNLPFAPIGLQGAGQQLFGGQQFGYPGAFAAIAPQLMNQVQGVIPGIAHSAPNAFYNQLGGVSPWNVAQAALGNTGWNNNAWTNQALNGAAFNPFAQAAGLNGLNGLTGLGHTGLDQPFNNSFADPYAAARISQTFPFVHWGYSPFGWPTV